MRIPRYYHWSITNTDKGFWLIDTMDVYRSLQKIGYSEVTMMDIYIYIYTQGLSKRCER